MDCLGTHGLPRYSVKCITCYAIPRECDVWIQVVPPRPYGGYSTIENSSAPELHPQTNFPRTQFTFKAAQLHSTLLITGWNKILSHGFVVRHEV